MAMKKCPECGKMKGTMPGAKMCADCAAKKGKKK